MIDIVDKIKEAREELSSLEDGWDGEDGIAPNSETMERAFELVRKIAALCDTEIAQSLLDTLCIEPSNYGEIDIDFKNEQKRIVIRVLSDKSKGFAYYGDNRDKIYVWNTIHNIDQMADIVITFFQVI